MDTVIESEYLDAPASTGSGAARRADERSAPAEDERSWRRLRDIAAVLPPAGLWPDELVGPAWAETWARAIVCFWETELAHERLALSEPAYLLDLAPGCGQLVWLLMRAVEAQRAASAVAQLNVRYVACAADDATAKSLIENVRLAPLVAQGRFEMADWRMSEYGSPGLLGLFDRTGKRMTTTNPVVALAAGLFGRQPADLFAAHYGQCLQAEVALSPSEDTPGEYRLDYRWQSTAARATEPLWQPLIDHYLANVVSAPVLLPSAALTSIDALEHFASGRYLLLACDEGACTERDVRDAELSPPQVWTPGTTSLPVNFHALAWRQRSAWTYARRPAEDGLVLYAAWGRTDGPPPQASRQAMRAILDQWAPLDAWRLARTAATACDDSSLQLPLALLRASKHDPRVLAAIGRHWPAEGASLPPDARHAWRCALQQTWDNFLPTRATEPIARDMGLMAVTLGGWRIATEAFGHCLACGEELLMARFYLAYSLASSGRLGEALMHAARACRLAPDSDACRALYDELKARMARRRALDWYRAALARDGDLTIEPLGPEHARLLADCHATPHIAIMANVAELCSVDEAHAWIDEESNTEGKMNCAVIDDEHGFIGVVSLARAETSGHFCFWVRADRQGQGAGTRAARRLFAMAEAAGVTDFFTSVYHANGHSQRALTRLGFHPLPVHDSEEPAIAYFHRRAARMDGATDTRGLADIVERLRRFYEDIGERIG